MRQKQVYDRCPFRNLEGKKGRGRGHNFLGLSLRDAKEGYLLDLQAARQAQSTIEAKEVVLRQLVEYSEAHDWPPVEELTVVHLRHYFADIRDRPRWFSKQGKDKPISASYYQTIYRRINTFFNWLADEGHIEPNANPMLRIKRPRLEERVIPVVEPDDFQVLIKLRDPALYKTPTARFRAFRDQAVLWVLVDTSVRREGITGLRVDDVDLSNRRLLLMEKGRKERYAPIGNTTAKALWRYLVEREKLKPATDDLWVDATGEAMTPDWVSSMLQRWGDRAGVPNLHPHRFRHTFAVTMLEEGTPETVLEGLGGWKKIPKTYTATIGDKQAREWHQRVSPADRLAKGMRKK
ncbi:MAG: tyrosine-type recombinase/integrase [Dehalococcoidia bacterium]